MLGRTSPTQRAAADAAARPLVAHFLERAAADAQRPAVRWKRRGIWQEETWSGYRGHVERAALGLLAMGVGEGATVLALGRPTPGWLYLDLAAQSIGALPVATHATMPADAVARVVEAVRPAVVLLTRRDQLERFLALGPAADCVEHLILEAPPASTEADRRLVTLDELETRGDEERGADADLWPALVRARDAGAPAVVAVSSGTTGDARLAVLSSENLLGAWSWLGGVPSPPGRADRIVSSMALGHLAERGLSQVAPILFGSVVHFPEDELSLTEAMREIRPTIFYAPPTVWEAEAGAAVEAMRCAPVVRRGLYRLAERVTRVPRESGRSGPAWRLGRAAARRLVMGPLLHRFGHRCLRLALSGGDRLAPSVADQWAAWGLRLRELYGSVECAGAAAVLDAVGSGVVARPRDTEVTLAENGEILVHGRNVAARYWDGSAVDRDDDRRLRTGDYGRGDLEVLGPTVRRLQLTDGTAVDPAPVEAVVRGSPFVAQAVVVGDGWPGLGALLEPDIATLASWARRRRIGFASAATLLRDTRVHELLAAEVEEANRTLTARGAPPIAAHRVLPGALVPGLDVTPTGAVRAAAVADRHRAVIDELSEELSAGAARGSSTGEQPRRPTVLTHTDHGPQALRSPSP